MEYHEIIKLKDGRECVLRSGEEKDGAASLANFLLTHGQTDYLLSYPDECGLTEESEIQFLKAKKESDCEIEILAEIDGRIVGLAGFNSRGRQEKIRHRAEFGISIDKEYWGLGIGRAMTRVCIECAKKAGLLQLELEVVAENRTAVALYESEGFEEYGRNPEGFRLRTGAFQELVLMRLDLTAR